MATGKTWNNDVIHTSLALHTDLSISRRILVYSNLYGNGFEINFSPIPESEYSHMWIRGNNVLIDNVILHGPKPENMQYLSQLSDSNAIIYISEDTNYLQNVKISNCRIEYGFHAIHAKGVDLTIAGCIIKNTFSAGINIDRNNFIWKSSNVVIRDCAFSNSLLGAVLFNLEQNPDNKDVMSTLKLEENVYMFNWVAIDEFRFASEEIKKHVSDVDGQIQKMINGGINPNYLYSVSNKKYIMLGIIQELDINPKAVGISIQNYKFKSYGDVSYAGQKNPSSALSYVKTEISGGINLAGIGVAESKLKLYTQTVPQGKSIKTIDIEVNADNISSNNYYDDGEMYEKIRQSFN